MRISGFTPPAYPAVKQLIRFGGEPHEVFHAMKDWAESNPKVVERVANGATKAGSYLYSNPRKSIAQRDFERASTSAEKQKAAAEVRAAKQAGKVASWGTRGAGTVYGLAHGDLTGAVGKVAANAVSRPVRSFVEDAYHVGTSSQHRHTTFRQGVRMAEDNGTKCIIM